MLKLPPEVRAKYDLSSLTCAFHAAAPLPGAVKEQIIAGGDRSSPKYYAGTEGNGFWRHQFAGMARKERLGGAGLTAR